MEIINVFGNTDKLSFLPQLGSFAIVQFYHQYQNDTVVPDRSLAFSFKECGENRPDIYSLDLYSGGFGINKEEIIKFASTLTGRHYDSIAFDLTNLAAGLEANIISLSNVMETVKDAFLRNQEYYNETTVYIFVPEQIYKKGFFKDIPREQPKEFLHFVSQNINGYSNNPRHSDEDKVINEIFKWQWKKAYCHEGKMSLSDYINKLIIEQLEMGVIQFKKDALGSGETKISSRAYYQIINGVTEDPDRRTLDKFATNLKLNEEQKEQLYRHAGKTMYEPEESFADALKRTCRNHGIESIYQVANATVSSKNANEYGDVAGSPLIDTDDSYLRKLARGEKKSPSTFILLKLCTRIQATREEAENLWRAAGYELIDDACFANKIMFEIFDGRLSYNYITTKLKSLEQVSQAEYFTRGLKEYDRGFIE